MLALAKPFLVLWITLASSTSWAGNWFIDANGTFAIPRDDTRYEATLGTSFGIGFHAENGIGARLVTNYIPLARTDIPDGVVENHFIAVDFTPRYTIGRKVVRFTLSAGAGALLERTTVSTTDLTTGESSTKGDWGRAASAIGGAELELHFFDGAGLRFFGAYRQLFNAPSNSLIEIGGGLLLSF